MICFRMGPLVVVHLKLPDEAPHDSATAGFGNQLPQRRIVKMSNRLVPTPLRALVKRKREPRTITIHRSNERGIGN